MKQNYLRIAQILIMLLMSGTEMLAQNYAWMKGPVLANQPGTYGTIGVAAATNLPGARELHTSWKNATGDLWLFGGEGRDATTTEGFLNDLWKYNIATKNWTWMKGSNSTDNSGTYGTMGISAAANTPGAREGAVSWTDASGNLWLFGGDGLDGTFNEDMQNDLWKYNVATNQWTWVRGSNTGGQNGAYGTQGTAAAGNDPGGRMFGAGWADASGNLWLFGGLGYDVMSFGSLNDVWKYNIASNQWTWMGGSNTADQNGVYGTQGVAANTNMPGGRYLSSTWKDAAGNLWLHGGSAFDATSSSDNYINDLWKYNMTSHQWTWMGGSNISAMGGTYGTINVPAASNIPGARLGSVCWSDPSGSNLFLLGGYGLDVLMNDETLNDLWKYNIASGQWTWLKGGNTGTPTGVYGMQGLAAMANTPPGRGAAVSWQDGSGNAWIFGGTGDSNTGSPISEEFNDLWKLSCPSTLSISIAASDNSTCLGQVITFTATGGASSYVWSTPASQTGSVSAVTSTVVGSITLICYIIDANGCAANEATSTFVTYALPDLSAGTTNTVICKGSPATLTVSGASTYVWSANNSTLSTSQSVTVTPIATTTYVVKGTGMAGCESTSTLALRVDLCTGINEQTGSDIEFTMYPNPNNGAFTLASNVFGENSALLIFNTLGQKVHEQPLNAQQTSVQTELQKGVYYYTIMHNSKPVSTGKMLIE